MVEWQSATPSSRPATGGENSAKARTSPCWPRALFSPGVVIFRNDLAMSYQEMDERKCRCQARETFDAAVCRSLSKWPVLPRFPSRSQQSQPPQPILDINHFIVQLIYKVFILSDQIYLRLPLNNGQRGFWQTLLYGRPQPIHTLPGAIVVRVRLCASWSC